MPEGDTIHNAALVGQEILEIHPDPRPRPRRRQPHDLLVRGLPELAVDARNRLDRQLAVKGPEGSSWGMARLD